MAIDSIGVTSSTTTVPTNASLGQDEFMKILLTQLQFQDPMKPMDNQEFMAQMAQFTTLEMSRQQNDKTETLLTIQSATQALSLIGKTVEVRTDAGAQVGSVTAVAFQNGSPVMTVKTASGAYLTDVRLSQVALVRS
jgi:flagellar basal-body rod modification protein FlgD